MTLDFLSPRRPARIVGVEWDRLVPDEAKRLRNLGIEEGAEVTVTSRGIFAGRDPLAVQIGRTTLALRRSHARAITVETLTEEVAQTA